MKNVRCRFLEIKTIDFLSFDGRNILALHSLEIQEIA
jgi:hypothetical protein